MKPVKTYTVHEATKALEHYCAYQERCHKEVTAKLKQMRMIPEAQEQILLHLLQHNYLNEERFAKTFARSKFNQKKWGKIKITQELKFREISSYNIKNALKEISEEDYLKSITTLIQKKVNTINT
ncbi:MAG TPA: RecX family transcriptional regulator, partial [Flavobacteriaceae bacterium]|nr:RecX family transcriptional regulator [Flavobacteriaceae bacterium]